MPDNWIDAESLEGDALTAWYRRSPAEIDAERQATAARRYQNFFYGSSRSNPEHVSQTRASGVAPSPTGSAPVSTPRVGPLPPAWPSSNADRVITYGALQAPAPSDQELADLRRQQAAFSDTTRKIDLHNSWFAAPALAAPLAVMGLEGAAAWAARTPAPKIEQAALQFSEREPYLRVGDNWATRAGRRAHAWLEQRVESKPGWDYEPNATAPNGRLLKPDVGTPQRNPADLTRRYYLELKPNTPTGRSAAARAVKKYSNATGRPARPIYYDPEDFI